MGALLCGADPDAVERLLLESEITRIHVKSANRAVFYFSNERRAGERDLVKSFASMNDPRLCGPESGQCLCHFQHHFLAPHTNNLMRSVGRIAQWPDTIKDRRKAQ